MTTSEKIEELDRLYTYRNIDGEPVEHVQGYGEYPEEQQTAIIQWISENCSLRSTWNYKASSYKLKHMCERSLGFYVSNVCMKTAMRLMCYEPKNPEEINHFYKVNIRPGIDPQTDCNKWPFCKRPSR